MDVAEMSRHVQQNHAGTCQPVVSAAPRCDGLFQVPVRKTTQCFYALAPRRKVPYVPWQKMSTNVESQVHRTSAHSDVPAKHELGGYELCSALVSGALLRSFAGKLPFRRMRMHKARSGEGTS